MRLLLTRPLSNSTTPKHTEKGRLHKVKKFFGILLKLIAKLAKVALIAFVVTFLIYIFNAENKLIYHVVRPFLNKHYNSQVRDRRI